MQTYFRGSGGGAVLSPEFAQDTGLAALWKGFLSRNGLNESDDFPAVMGKISRFLQPVIAGSCENMTRDSKKGVWKARNTTV